MADVEKKIQEVQGPDSSVLDALRFHNSDWAHAGNSLYLQLALLGTTEDPAGAEVVDSRTSCQRADRPRAEDARYGPR